MTKKSIDVSSEIIKWGIRFLVAVLVLCWIAALGVLGIIMYLVFG